MTSKAIVEQFPKWKIARFMDEISRAGYYAVESDFPGTGYMITSDTIAIFAGKNGMLSIGIDSIETFANELLQIKDLAIDRKRMKVRGA